MDQYRQEVLTIMKYQKLFAALLLAITMAWSGSVLAAENSKAKPLIIQEQGSFAVGGTVVTEPGTFAAEKKTPEGQTLHGDHAYVFYQIPVNVINCRLCSCMEPGSFQRHGKQLRTVGKGFKIYFCGVVSEFI